MVSSKRNLIILLIILWLMWVSTYFFISIELRGEKKIELPIGTQYQESGAVAHFFGVSIPIKVKSQLNVNKVGKYTIIYKARNFLGIVKTKKREVKVVDYEKPTIKLQGKVVESITLKSIYREPGYSAFDKNDGDLTNKVKVENHVNVNKAGNYSIFYSVKDSSGNKTTIKRTVMVKKPLVSYEAKYNNIDNTKNSWWTDNKFDQKRPAGGADINQLKKYNAYFMGPDEKKIYLTFDEGSNDTYLDQIAEILTKNNVKATFFLCGHYMEDHQEQVRKWVRNGHSIGNHTFHHRSTPDYANENGFSEFKKEIVSMEELYQKITGKPMDKIYRDPKGEWSYRGLKLVQDLGYKSFFWSADYLDFDKTYSKQYSYEQMIKRYHNGAIYLLHPSQKGTYQALEDFILQMKKLGYEFGLVRDISY